MSLRAALLLLPCTLLAAALALACSSESSPATPDPAATPPPPTATPTPATPTATPDATPVPPSPTATVPPATPAPDTPAATLIPAFPGLPRYDRPIDLVDVPHHSLYLLVLQEGRVLAIPHAGLTTEPRTVLDHRDATTCCSEEGMLSIALDPDFAQNGYLYAYYSPSREGPRITRLSRFATEGQGETFVIDAASELVILEIDQPYFNHNGGTVLFGPDGMLYLGIGDGGSANDPHLHGQNLATHLSTIIRIDVRHASPERPYAIPSDNPFLNDRIARPEIWAYGLRNPWRMSFDPETGLLWAGDVGQRDVEEVSIIERGGNYGWNTMEGSRCFDPPQGCDRTDLILPVAEYSHDVGCSITGGYVYRGEAIPALQGWYLYSDYCTGDIWAIPAETAAAGGYFEPLLLWDDPIHSVVSFAETAEGELFVITFVGDRVYRLVAP